MKKRTTTSQMQSGVQEMKQHAAQNNAQIPCDSCEQNIAVMYCFQCDGNLCEQCDAQIHNNKLMSRHVRAANFHPQKCQKHSGFTTMLCANCQELICINCLVDGHRGHSIQQLPESFEIVQQEINQILTKMNEKLTQITRLDQLLGEQTQQLNGSCDQVMESIRENFLILNNQLNQKQQQLESQIQLFRSQIQQDIDRKQLVVQNYGQSLVSARKSILQQLEKVLNVEQFQSQEQLYLQKLAQFIQNFIQNQENYEQLTTDTQQQDQISLIIQQLNQEFNVKKQFCLDFSSVQKFVSSIEGLYLVVQQMGEQTAPVAVME